MFGYIFSSLNSFLLIFIELSNMKRAIWTCLLLKLVLTIVLDVTFLSSLSFSLQLGVKAWVYFLPNAPGAPCCILRNFGKIW